VGGNHIDTLRREITSMEFVLMGFLAILVGSARFFRYCKKRRNSNKLSEGWGDMAEPFPDIPDWLVWGMIGFVILIGTLCLATLNFIHQSKSLG
jgi:hypothetical protein